MPESVAGASGCLDDCGLRGGCGRTGAAAVPPALPVAAEAPAGACSEAVATLLAERRSRCTSMGLRTTGIESVGLAASPSHGLAVGAVESSGAGVPAGGTTRSEGSAFSLDACSGFVCVGTAPAEGTALASFGAAFRRRTIKQKHATAKQMASNSAITIPATAPAARPEEAEPVDGDELVLPAAAATVGAPVLPTESADTFTPTEEATATRKGPYARSNAPELPVLAGRSRDKSATTAATAAIADALPPAAATAPSGTATAILRRTRMYDPLTAAVPAVAT